MNNKEIKREFDRWIEIGKPKVWHKYKKESNWSKINIPSWDNDSIYIVDDHQAEIRKALIDNSDIEIEYFDTMLDRWCPSTLINPFRFLDFKMQYRIKPKPKTETVYEWMYKSKAESSWNISGILMTEDKAKNFFDPIKVYKKTGREFEVGVEDN